MDAGPLVLTWVDFAVASDTLAAMARSSGVHRPFAGVYGVPRGGLPLAVALSHRLGLPLLEAPHPTGRTLWVDDVIETGATARAALDSGLDLLPCCWVWKGAGRKFAGPALIGLRDPVPADRWVVFPWEDRARADADLADYRRRRGIS